MQLPSLKLFVYTTCTPIHLFFGSGGRERKIVEGIKPCKKSRMSFLVAFE